MYLEVFRVVVFLRVSFLRRILGVEVYEGDVLTGVIGFRLFFVFCYF